MLRRFAIALSASLVFAASAGACGSDKKDDSATADDSIQVVAATNVYGDIVEQIVGITWQALLLIGRRTEPE